MKRPVDHTPLTLSIAAVERDTGLSKDTLRVWQRRYGFPLPKRDALGERAYPIDQVEKLRIIKRLMDGGQRPGRLVNLSLAELLSLGEHRSAALGRMSCEVEAAHLRTLLDLMRAHDTDGLRRQLQQAQLRLGLQRFVCELVIPLNTLVGDAWLRGQLQIHEEHAYSEAIQVVLRGALAMVPAPAALDRPRVLLSTFPGEPHSLGLLMAEAMFALEGAKCLSLGAQTPLWDLVLATAAYKSDILALAFTGCMNPNQVVEGLTELRAKLPPAVQIWVGGSAPVLYRRPVEGVMALAPLAAIRPQVEQWRHGSPE